MMTRIPNRLGGRDSWVIRISQKFPIEPWYGIKEVWLTRNRRKGVMPPEQSDSVSYRPDPLASRVPLE